MQTAAPSPKELALSQCWAAIKKGNPNEKQGLPAKTWAEMPLRTRAGLVMLGAKTMDDPREVARRPWESLSGPDKEGIAACAKEMRKHLQAASCLF